MAWFPGDKKRRSEESLPKQKCSTLPGGKWAFGISFYSKLCYSFLLVDASVYFLSWITILK